MKEIFVTQLHKCAGIVQSSTTFVLNTIICLMRQYFFPSKVFQTNLHGATFVWTILFLVFNTIIQAHNMPALWKRSIIKPFLKKGKTQQIRQTIDQYPSSTVFATFLHSSEHNFFLFCFPPFLLPSFYRKPAQSSPDIILTTLELQVNRRTLFGNPPLRQNQDSFKEFKYFLDAELVVMALDINHKYPPCYIHWLSQFPIMKRSYEKIWSGKVGSFSLATQIVMQMQTTDTTFQTFFFNHKDSSYFSPLWKLAYTLALQKENTS